jgi:hypothetical protein
MTGPDNTAIDRLPLETAVISEMDKVCEEKKRANLEAVSEADKETARDCFLCLQATTFLGMEVGLQTHYVLELSR